MFGKLMKYNLKFGQNTFLAMAAILVFASIFLRVIASNILHSMDILSLIVFIIMPVSITCVVLVFQNFNRSLYGNQGYFTLTLPVKKSDIVLSQLLTALIWFVFIVIMTGVSLTILLGFGDLKEVLSQIFVVGNIPFFLMAFASMLLYVSLIILIVFMGITLSNVSISGKKMNVGIALVGTFAYIMIGNFIENFITKIFGERNLYLMYNGNQVVMTMDYAQKVGEEITAFSMDLVSLAWTVLFATGTYLLTVYLLKKRVDLK